MYSKIADSLVCLTGALTNALVSLAHSVEMDVKYTDVLDQRPDFVNVFVIVMEIPVLHWPEYLDNAFPCVCQAIGALPKQGKAKLARIWSRFSSERLKEMVQGLQQMITVKVRGFCQPFNSSSQRFRIL